MILSHRKLVALAILVALPAVSSARADVVTDWNLAAINASAIPPNSILQSRILAIAHQAMYDAVRTIGGNRPAYAVELKAPSGASVEAAAAAAAHRALVKLIPSQRSALDAALNATLSRVSDARAKTDGIEIGAQVADALIAVRNGDHCLNGVGSLLSFSRDLPALKPRAHQHRAVQNICVISMRLNR